MYIYESSYKFRKLDTTNRAVTNLSYWFVSNEIRFLLFPHENKDTRREPRVTGGQRGQRAGGAAAALVGVVAQVVEGRRVGVAVGAPLVLLDEQPHVGLAAQRHAHRRRHADPQPHSHQWI